MKMAKSWAVGAGLLAIVIAGASPARAADRITAKVPFAFIVNNVELPSGDYVVRDVSDGEGVLAIESADGRHSAVINTIPRATTDDYSQDEPTLSFKEYEGRHFLSLVTDEEGTTREVPLTTETMMREIAVADSNVK
jgi:hypothetical protein